MNGSVEEIILWSLLAGLTTLVGALIVFLLGIPSRRIMAGYLGFAAGIMTVVAYELLVQGYQVGERQAAMAGVLFGVGFMLLAATVIDAVQRRMRLHERHQDGDYQFLRIGWTMVLGMAAHNIPEGMAVAAGDAANHQLGGMVLLAMAIHNIPEGIGITAPLLRGKMNKGMIMLILVMISLCEPLGTWIGTHIIGTTVDIIAMALGFAAGAMLYIVFFELLPMSIRQHPAFAGLGVVCGSLLFIL